MMKTNTVFWMLKKGNTDYKRPLTMNYLLTAGKPSLLAVPIYGCAWKKPPEEVNHDGAHLLDYLMVDFKKTDESKFNPFVVDGRKVCIVTYVIEVAFVIESGVLEFTAQIRHENHPGTIIGRLRHTMKDLVQRQDNYFLRSLFS
ncbi:hypothetical protein BJY04DRAFT_16025 [Aspergillus karnatakaensis]|uniref:uncharacterized protein n=1 Tax=Aspergillus karnatakaensis TaxID=1810916 RepID=UPI003CCDBD2F